MKVLILGATGMVGQGVLQECLSDPGVTDVVTIGRTGSGRTSRKLREIIRADLFAAGDAIDGVEGFDACFFCLGVSALGLTEAEYARTTYDLTMAIAAPLARDNPNMTFVYVSGTGTGVDSRMMWARVKGRTERALADLPFGAVYLFRPGFIQPRHGIVSRTGWYRALYAAMAPVSALLGRIAPAAVTSTEQVGLAMLSVARRGFPSPVLGNREINRAAS